MMNDFNSSLLSIIINQLSFIKSVGKINSKQTEETHFYGHHKREFP